MSEAARGDARYQSRDTPGGKPQIRPPRATSIALAAAFVAAAWLNSWPLLFAAATGLLWRLPARPLAPATALALPRERVTIRLDLPFLLACWALATWALWQHRLLPLAVCAAALLLALLDVRERARKSGLDERGGRVGEPERFLKKVLITGIAGGQGRLLAKRLSERYEVCGVDRMSWEGAPRKIRVHSLDLRKKRFRNIVRTEAPDAVVHLAFVRHFRLPSAVRHEVNVGGTQRLLEACAESGIDRVVVLSSSYVYGALPDNPRYMHEGHPLNVSRTFPEMRDLAEVEGLVGSFVWQYPKIATSILRPVNTLGYYVHSAIGTYLKLDILPTVAGYDPMMQFIHEEDLSEAIVLALENRLNGVYNVAGPSAVPLKTAIRAIGRTSIPVPEPLIGAIIRQLFRMNVYSSPAHALDFIKYPCTVSGEKFVRATGFKPLFSLEDIFASVAR